MGSRDRLTTGLWTFSQLSFLGLAYCVVYRAEMPKAWLVTKIKYAQLGFMHGAEIVPVTDACNHVKGFCSDVDGLHILFGNALNIRSNEHVRLWSNILCWFTERRRLGSYDCSIYYGINAGIARFWSSYEHRSIDSCSNCRGTPNVLKPDVQEGAFVGRRKCILAPCKSFYDEVRALVQSKRTCGLPQSLARYFYTSPSSTGRSFGSNSLTTVQFQSLPIQLQGLIGLSDSDVSLLEGCLHSLPLHSSIKCIEDSNQGQYAGEKYLDPFKRRVALKEYLHGVGWLLMISGIVFAGLGVIFVAFSPSLPDKRRALFVGISGLGLIVAAYFSIHGGLGLLYTH